PTRPPGGAASTGTSDCGAVSGTPARSGAAPGELGAGRPRDVVSRRHQDARTGGASGTGAPTGSERAGTAGAGAAHTGQNSASTGNGLPHASHVLIAAPPRPSRVVATSVGRTSPGSGPTVP